MVSQGEERYLHAPTKRLNCYVTMVAREPPELV